MKPLRMVWAGMSDEGHITAGKKYLIVSKEREVEPNGTIWYTYVFVDDAGLKGRAASFLFLKPKRIP